MKVFFSLREANNTIPKIKPLIEVLIQLTEELEVLDNTKIEFDNENIENYMLEVELNKNFHEKNLQLYNILADLIKQGCIVRNLDDMEVTFYSKLGNKDINLCWKYPHEKISYWRYPNENINTKRDIKEIEKQYFEKLNELK